MGVPRGTTPTITLTLDDETIDLTLASAVYVTFSKKGLTVTKTGEDLTVAAQTVEVALSQTETLEFERGPVKVQLNWKFIDGSRQASTVEKIDLTEQLLEREV